jgi:two-component system cell cycle sensor histidine kinase/response regulator CckA
MALMPKILIVDDEPLMCSSLTELMSMQGYDALSANSGKEAHEKLSEYEFDVALLDMNLPDTDGHRMMDHINSVSPETIIIMITGTASLDSAIGALKRGAYDFVQKPVEYDYLTKVIQNALGQKRLKDENTIINNKLQLSEQRYRNLVQNSPDIIYTLDKQGKFTFVSSVADKLLGYNGSQLIGAHYSTIIHEDDLEKAEGVFNNRQTGEQATSGIELRLKVSEEDARLSKFKDLIVELKCSGIYDYSKDGNDRDYIGTYGVARDISRRKHLEATLNNAQKMEAIGTLAGGIAHDFNNLLMGVQGYASIMLLDIESGHPNYEKLKSIEQYVQRGADLTRQLLGFTKGVTFDVKTIDINNLIKNSSLMFGRTKKEIIIHEKLGHNIRPIDADSGQIEQVLLNLFLNASHAMPNGGELTLATENKVLNASSVAPYHLEPGEYVMISVQDNGVGMDPVVRRRIFEPFFTTKEIGRGTGLGLASAYGIIKNHNGFIDVESTKGVGTTFKFYLPVSGRNVAREEPDDSRVLKGPETVLLVDDELMIIEVGVEILKALGYGVILANSGEEAIDIYRNSLNQIDIVVLDMIMPGMGGSETFDQLKEINPEVKVLLSSGYSVDGMATDILERGCQQFIQKPFDIKELSRKLRDVLD